MEKGTKTKFYLIILLNSLIIIVNSTKITLLDINELFQIFLFLPLLNFLDTDKFYFLKSLRNSTRMDEDYTIYREENLFAESLTVLREVKIIWGAS